jgi:predicted membrane protein (TIGR00267 family)
MVSLRETLEGAAFGTTDGIICSLGTIIGAAAATQSPGLAIIAGTLAGVSNSFANGIGMYISQSTERGLQKAQVAEGEQTHVHSVNENVINALASFCATILVSLAMVVPFLFLAIGPAMACAFAVGVLLLFMLGAYTAKISKESMLSHGIQYSLLGVAGAVIGYLVGEQLRVLML